MIPIWSTYDICININFCIILVFVWTNLVLFCIEMNTWCFFVLNGLYTYCDLLNGLSTFMYCDLMNGLFYIRGWINKIANT